MRRLQVYVNDSDVEMVEDISKKMLVSQSAVVRYLLQLGFKEWHEQQNVNKSS
jgi:hypothetical protein